MHLLAQRATDTSGITTMIWCAAKLGKVPNQFTVNVLRSVASAAQAVASSASNVPVGALRCCGCTYWVNTGRVGELALCQLRLVLVLV
jgi:hypothetical protein